MSARKSPRRTFAQIRAEERADMAANLLRLALRIQHGRSPESDRRGTMDHDGEAASSVAAILKGVSSSIEGGVFDAQRLWPVAEASAPLILSAETEGA